MMHLSKIAEVINSKQSFLFEEEPVITHLLTDSRQSSNPLSTLFIAIKGNRHDAHKYIPGLIKRGFTFFLVSEDYQVPSQEKTCHFLKVKDTLLALQQLASYKRSLFQSPVIGITGSNGKTIVKEWLHHMLSQEHAIIKSPKSYNSQLGVPLSVWPLSPLHDVGIFEAGISEKGEMQKLQTIIAPTQGIITNLGSAHDEGFDNREEKLREKLQLFEESEFVIFREDHSIIAKHLQNNSLSFSPVSWSTKSESADYFIKFSKKEKESHISIWKDGVSWNFSVPFTDEASLENITHCIILCLHQGLDFFILQERLNTLHPVNMRMEILSGINNCYLINDAYNNDLVGLKMALDFSFQQFPDKKHSLILSDLLETGINEDELYTQLEQLLHEFSLDKIIGIGPQLNGKRFLTHSCNTTDDLFKLDLANLFEEEVLLIKGARVFGFEKIIERLIQKKHQTELIINLDAIAHNLNYYRSILKPQTKLLAMVKAFAYGSGSHEIAQLLQHQQIDYLGVAYVDEGVSLRKAGIHLPILVLNTSPFEFDRLLQYKLEPEIYSLNQLQKIISFAEKKQVEINIHLKVDTGMHRLGFLQDELEIAIQLVQKTKHIHVKGAFSHLAAAEDPKEDKFTIKQIQLFERSCQQIEERLGYSFIKHIVNSSGITRFPGAHFDMVRLGIGMYGISSLNDEQKKLEIVGELRSTISQIKTIAKDETIGYNRKGKITKIDGQKIAVIPIGYADGYDRRLGNGVGKVILNEKEVPIIGSICMDMCMVDITGVDAKEGDKVELFGHHILVQEIAKNIHTIPYEVLTNISQRVARAFISNT